MSNDDERLGAWVLTLPLSDQVMVAGSTLIIADVKQRNPGVFDALDEVALRESEEASEARTIAAEAAERYRGQGLEADAHRVVGLCDEIVRVIDRHFL